jgi:hypothetical protein
MRRILLLAGSWAGLISLRANATEPAAAPLGMPGYELRALDEHKRVLFQVGGSQVEVSVPIFAYCPSASPAARLLREAQASLVKLAAKPEWTADELRQVLSGLDEAAQLLERPTLPGHPVSAGKE